MVLTTDLVTKTLAFELVATSPVRLTDSVRLGFSPIPPHNAIPLLPSILSLKLTLNTGAIFGLGKGHQWFFIVVSMVAVLVLIRVFWMSRAQARVVHVALAMILAGAMGNLYDRIRFNAVRDLLWLFPEVKLPFGWRWCRWRSWHSSSSRSAASAAAAALAAVAAPASARPSGRP